MAAQADIDYASDLVKGAWEELFLSLKFAPAEKRNALLALYGFQTELQRIPSAVSEPPLGEIRLQWWRDALAEVWPGAEEKPVRAHPIVQLLAKTVRQTPAIKPFLDKAIDAHGFYLSPVSFKSLDQACQLFDEAEGYLPQAAQIILGSQETKKATRAGTLFVMSRLLVSHQPAAKSAMVRPQGDKFAELILREGEGALADLNSQAVRELDALNGASAEVMPALAHFSLIKPRLKRALDLSAGAPPKKETPMVGLQKRWRIFRTVITGKF